MPEGKIEGYLLIDVASPQIADLRQDIDVALQRNPWQSSRHCSCWARATTANVRTPCREVTLPFLVCSIEAMASIEKEVVAAVGGEPVGENDRRHRSVAAEC